MAALLSFVVNASTIVDTYTFRMTLHVPRIHDNSLSLGYRRYQTQLFKGELQVSYKEDGTVETKVLNLVNRTHKINNNRITYVCHDWPYDDNSGYVVGIGSNRTKKFSQAGVKFGFVADPSYNIGEIDEDNTLMLELSGYGSLKEGWKAISFRGMATGQIGCGCSAYGHISPTRLYLGYLTDIVVDIAPVCGNWRATWQKRQYLP